MWQMAYEVTIETVRAQPLAASRERTTLATVSQQIQGLLAPVWDFLHQRPGLRTDGHNVALYWAARPDGPVEVGVQVTGPFDETAAVVNGATPAGTVATTAYFGPYTGLRPAHEAVVAWCRANGHPLAGPFWEVYGDWDEDPAKLRTDVYYLLA